jgi:hypothetical protein
MTKLDMLKAIAGALIALPIMYAFMVVLLAAQP